MSAIAADAPADAEVRSAAETAGTDETEGSSVRRTRCSVSMVVRPCASMPTLGSAIAGETSNSFFHKFISDNKYDFSTRCQMTPTMRDHYRTRKMWRINAVKRENDPVHLKEERRYFIEKFDKLYFIKYENLFMYRKDDAKESLIPGSMIRTFLRLLLRQQVLPRLLHCPRQSFLGKNIFCVQEHVM